MIVLLTASTPLLTLPRSSSFLSFFPLLSSFSLPYSPPLFSFPSLLPFLFSSFLPYSSFLLFSLIPLSSSFLSLFFYLFLLLFLLSLLPSFPYSSPSFHSFLQPPCIFSFFSYPLQLPFLPLPPFIVNHSSSFIPIFPVRHSFPSFSKSPLSPFHQSILSNCGLIFPLPFSSPSSSFPYPSPL